MNELTIIIPVFTAVKQAYECVSNILESDAATCNMIVLADGTLDGAAKLVSQLESYENIRVISHLRNRGYTRNFQIGLESTETEYVCFMNCDALVPSVWSKPLIRALEMNPYLAAIGPLSNNASYQSIPNVTSHCGFTVNEHFGQSLENRESISFLTNAMFNSDLIDVPMLDGFCTVFRTATVRNIGGFDCDIFPTGYGEEKYMCTRMTGAGYRLAVIPSVFVYHKKTQPLSLDRETKLPELGAKLVDTYGLQHVPDLEAVLRNSIKLNSVRKLAAIIFDFLQSGEAISDSLFTLLAGKSVIVDNENNVVSEASHALAYGKIEVLRNGAVSISAPRNKDLSWLKGSEIKSLSALLMYHSTIEPVFLELSEQNSKAMNQQHRVWLESLEFDRLYQSSPKLVS